MIRFIYASRATVTPDDFALASLLKEARTNNQAVSLTGMLVYAQHSFLQLVEGPDQAVDDLHDRLLRDLRHRDMRVLERSVTESRSFSEWNMGFAHPDDSSLSEELPGFRSAPQFALFNPDLIADASTASALLSLYGANPAMNF